MNELHKNLIDGEWVGGEGIENINPSNTDEVVGLYAPAPVPRTRSRRLRRPRRRSRRGRARASWSATPS